MASRSSSLGAPSCAASNRPPPARLNRSPTSASLKEAQMVATFSSTGRDTFVGSPHSRIDGPAKVTGLAKYAGEFSAPDLAHGTVVSSAIAKGRIQAIDIADAEAVPGVIKVFTHENRPRTAWLNYNYQDAVAPPARPSGRSTTTGSTTAASPSPWWWRRISRRRASPRRW